ncbi:hypothetical protein [Pseudomaricurvus sp.]|uniref:hypothetical protein n=1 Tax=Pseudomaricurvus sp. TaxID=2004510 RepID=UPI003F6AEEB8
MCFGQPRIPRHRILKEQYNYSLSGRKSTPRWAIMVRSLIIVLIILAGLVFFAEYSRDASLQQTATPETHKTARNLQPQRA